ncbi:LOW QUALITY PROTEIN: bactericidal permeability-increasing protein-like [Pituophis catenifer annectens]|uniref:LOW QUALITY PROTEIN: bactericidal permeability-increasing protein-like n=1 Tax=Pituophis catenifer annectens TaxID=94852 RepID=UPI00399218F0
MRRVSLLVFWLGCLVSASEGVNPGFAGRITRKGLDYACQEGVATLRKDLPAIILPEFSGTYRVKIIGNVNYRFYRLNIRRFELFHSTIEPMPGQGLRVSISNALAEMTGHWELKKRWLKDDGSFELKVDGISISVGLKLGSDATGRPTVTTLDCNTHISNVDIDISGKWEWLYNLFETKVESAFKTVMERKICEIVRTSVNSKLQPHLQSLPVTANIDHTSNIDYSLIGPPIATSDCVDLDLKGEFFSTGHRSPAPFPPPPLSFPVDHDRMVQFGISTYFFNTAGDVYYKAESLTFWVVDEMVPQEIKIRLNTSSFQPFIPQLKKLYHNMPMKLKVSPSSAPSLSITPETLSLTPSVDIQAFAILPNSSLAPLFLIGVTSPVSAKVAVNSTRIFGNLKLGRLKFSLKHSDVGFFSVQVLESLINFLTASILIPQMNARLAEGFPLPLLDHLELSNPILQAHQDFLVFASDVRYG